MDKEITDPVSFIFDALAVDPSNDLVFVGCGVESGGGIVYFEEFGINLASSLIGDADEFGEFFSFYSLHSRVRCEQCFGGIDCVERFDTDSAETFLFEQGEDLGFLFGGENEACVVAGAFETAAGF